MSNTSFNSVLNCFEMNNYPSSIFSLQNRNTP